MQRTTFESLKALHDRPGAADCKKVNARGRARTLAKVLRVPVPDWALHQPAIKKSKGSPQRKRQPASTGTVEPADSSAVQRALVTWRQQSSAHAVVTHADGRVTLRRGSTLLGNAEEATFASATDAAAALVPRIEWRKVARPERRFAAPQRPRGRSVGARP